MEVDDEGDEGDGQGDEGGDEGVDAGIEAARRARMAAVAASSKSEPARGPGHLLALVIQLASVELQMALYDQPGPTTEECRALLPACCQLLEEVTSVSGVADGAAVADATEWHRVSHVTLRASPYIVLPPPSSLRLRRRHRATYPSPHAVFRLHADVT